MTEQQKENVLICQLRQEIMGAVCMVGSKDALMEIYAAVLDRLYTSQEEVQK